MTAPCRPLVVLDFPHLAPLVHAACEAGGQPEAIVHRLARDRPPVRSDLGRVEGGNERHGEQVREEDGVHILGRHARPPSARVTPCPRME